MYITYTTYEYTIKNCSYYVLYELRNNYISKEINFKLLIINFGDL